MALTKAEMETVIRFDEQDGECHVYTHNPRLRRKLRDLLDRYPIDVKLRCVDRDFCTYTCPKAWVTINPTRKGTPLTEEQKAQAVRNFVK